MYSEEEELRQARRSRRLLAVGIALLVIGVALLWLEGRGAHTAGRESALVAADCKLLQRIEYARCGHTVLRRMDAPAGWAGMTHEGVLQALSEQEEGWRMTRYSADTIEMTCVPDLFCPQHAVLMLDADGTPGIWRNRWGFAMEWEEAVDLEPADEAERALLAEGVAFDSREALEAWIRARSGA